MLYCTDWEKKQKRYLEFWARENHDRPLLDIRVTKDHLTSPEPTSHHKTIKDLWMDTDYIIKRTNWAMQNTLYLGEAFPIMNPNLGPDYFAAGYGVELEFGMHTSWAKPFYSDHDAETYHEMVLDMQNKYYKKMEEITRAAVEDGKDKYLVGITDLHPGADALVSLRGPENLCYDIYDNPRFVKQGILDMFPGFVQVYDHLYNLTTKYQKGSTCWMPIWHPERWYVVSCDFSCMVSESTYEEMIVKEIEMEVNELDASMYHLDGPDALRHLDRILEIPNLNGIQWVYGVGQQTASHWIPVIQKIQAAGKCLYINVTASELEFMLQTVRPEGVLYSVDGVKNEEHARSLLKMAEQYTRKL